MSSQIQVVKRLKITSITAAIAVLLSSQAYAGGGSNGADGTSSINLIGDKKEGSQGQNGTNADGGDVTDPITNPLIQLTGSTVTATSAAGNGDSVTNSGGGLVGMVVHLQLVEFPLAAPVENPPPPRTAVMEGASAQAPLRCRTSF